VSTNVSLPKLRGSNYLYWKFDMEHILRSKKLLKYVNGRSPRPEDKDELEAWEEDDEQVQSIIASTVDQEFKHLLFDATTSQEMWEALRVYFQNSSEAAKMEIKEKFQTYKMKNGMTMDKNIARVRELVQEMQAVGIKVEESEKTLTLLRSLPPEYEFVAFTLRGESNLTFELACARLKDAERNLIKKGRKEDEEEALVSRKGGGGKNPRYPQNPNQRNQNPQNSQFPQRTCFHCKQAGHLAANCEKNKDKNIKCNRCGRMGHKMRDCKTKQENIGQGSGHLTRGDNMIAAIDGSALTGASSQGQDWVIDSGATHHMCNDEKAFQELKKLENPVSIRVGNDARIEASHIGTVAIATKVRGEGRTANLQKVLYVPDIAVNLLSVSSCTMAGNKVTFRGNGVGIYNKQGEMIGSGYKSAGLYVLARNLPIGQGFLAQGGGFELWHSRFGHLNAQSLSMLKNKEMVQGLEGIDLSKVRDCEVCAMGKMCKPPTKLLNGRGTTKKLELIYSDVCGPIGPTGINGMKYFVTFIDDFTRKTWVFTMKEKSEVFEKFQEFVAMVNNKGEEKVQEFFSDNGGEYKDTEFIKFCKSKGIELSNSMPYAQNQNGIAERYNRTIVECTRCLLSESGLTLRLWPEALMTAVHIKNRSPHEALRGEITPEEAWSGKKPSVKHFKKWGCKVSVLIPKQFQESKVGPKVWWGSFVGYAGKEMGFRIWSSEKQRVFLRRDVKFFEDSYLDNARESVDPTVKSDSDEGEAMIWIGRPRGRERDVRERDSEEQRESEEIRESEDSGGAPEPPSPRRSTRVVRRPERLTSEKLGELHLAHALLHQVEPESYELASGENITEEQVEDLEEPEDQAILDQSGSGDFEAVNKSKEVDFPYAEAIGALQYLSTCTRPDISMAVSSASRFLASPSLYHWGAVRRIFRYLAGSVDKGIMYVKAENIRESGKLLKEKSPEVTEAVQVTKTNIDGTFVVRSRTHDDSANFQDFAADSKQFEDRSSEKVIRDRFRSDARSNSDRSDISMYWSESDQIEVKVYSDSSFASEKEECRSREGYVAVIAGGAVSWYTRLQRITLSSTEAEYLAANEGGREIVFLNDVLDELGVKRDKSTLFMDNSSAIKQVKNPVFHKRSKHVKVKFHWLRQALKEEDFKIEWIKTEDMAADFLTKPVDQKVLSRNLCLIGM